MSTAEPEHARSGDGADPLGGVQQPSVAAHAGLLGFSTQKLWWGSTAGVPFPIGRWEGPDGRSIVAALDPGSYVAEAEGDPSRRR